MHFNGNAEKLLADLDGGDALLGMWLENSKEICRQSKIKKGEKRGEENEMRARKYRTKFN